MMNKEKLSQLLDDELDANEIESTLDSLLDEPELQRAWLAQHTARAAMRDKTVHPALDMVNRVALALEEEAVIIAPQNLEDSEPSRSRDATAAGTHKVHPLWPIRRRVLAYTAMAASVAALVFLGYTPEQMPAHDIAKQAASAPATRALEDDMQSMIVQHGEFSGATALNGLVAYAKVVNGNAQSNDR